MTVAYDAYLRVDGERLPQPIDSKSSRLQSTTKLNSTIYKEILQRDEFRLLGLSAVEDPDYPVHVSLETYPGDHHPEYETTSYLWGGEDGDYSMHHPVFIGPYWDVTLHTRSCWSMLRFLRPWGGVRTVFVDALCINQKDLQERGAQVAKMTRIYEGCTWVLVYLGEDIVTSSTPFRPSRKLVDLESEQHRPTFPEDHPLHRKLFGLDDFLGRKYFSRVWVIQELVFSERAIFPIGDVDYRADGHIISRVREVWENQLRVVAPWFDYLGSGGQAYSDNDIASLLHLTRKSQASDPRDVLFGVISLLDTRSAQSRVTPEYSISYLHFFVGLMAHLLLVEKEFGVLREARTISEECDQRCGRLPSWLPYLKKFKDPGYLSSITSSKEARISSIPTDILAEIKGRDVAAFDFRSAHHKEVEQLSGIISNLWNSPLRLCSKTGALDISLVHLFKFHSRPVLRGRNGGVCCFRVYSPKGPRPSAGMYLTTRHRLDLIIVPMTDRLFLLDSWDGSGKDPVFLILRQVHTESAGRPTFRIVASDPSMFEAWGPIDRDRKEQKMCVSRLRKTVACCIDQVLARKRSMSKQFPQDPGVHPLWQALFPGCLDEGPIWSGIMTLIRRTYSTYRSYKDPIIYWLENNYLGLNSDFGATIVRDFYVVLRFSSRDWQVSKHKFYKPSQTWFNNRVNPNFDPVRPFEGWFREPLSELPIWKRVMTKEESRFESMRSLDPQNQRELDGTPHPNETVLVYIRRDDIVRLLKEEVHWIVAELRQMAEVYDPPLDIDTMLGMVENGATEEQKSMGVPKMVGGVEVYGSVWRVRIE